MDSDGLRDLSLNVSGSFSQKSSLNVSLQQRLYLGIKQRILDGRLGSGARLPSSRALATDLGVSRNTVTAALEQLKSEGYLVGKPGAGHFVSDALPDDYLQAQSTEGSGFKAHQDMPQSNIAQILSDSEAPRIYHNASFEAGVPDLSAFPMRIWSTICSRHSQRTALLGYDSLQGYLPLREALANYLRASRGLDCTPERIIITTGAQQAANIAIELTMNPGDEVYLEDPGYIGMRSAFIKHGCRITGLPVAENGLPSEHLPQEPKGKLLCVTPTHQYPLGGIMPLAERLKVLQWASEHGVWILEDDYDSEYHYRHKPIASLQGLGLGEQVIYIGSFSKVLFPSLRLGYMVVPDAQVKACVKLKNTQAGQTPLVEQACVAEFMTEGHFVRHIRNMRERYKRKYETIVEACGKHLSEYFTLDPSGAGMHIVLILKPALCNAFSAHSHSQGALDLAIVAAMNRQNLYGSALSKYYISSEKHDVTEQQENSPIQQGLVLGFANTDASDMASKISQIRDILKDLMMIYGITT